MGAGHAVAGLGHIDDDSLGGDAVAELDADRIQLIRFTLSELLGYLAGQTIQNHKAVAALLRTAEL